MVQKRKNVRERAAQLLVVARTRKWERRKNLGLHSRGHRGEGVKLVQAHWATGKRGSSVPEREAELRPHCWSGQRGRGSTYARRHPVAASSGSGASSLALLWRQHAANSTTSSEEEDSSSSETAQAEADAWKASRCSEAGLRPPWLNLWKALSTDAAISQAWLHISQPLRSSSSVSFCVRFASVSF